IRNNKSTPIEIRQHELCSDEHVYSGKFLKQEPIHSRQKFRWLMSPFRGRMHQRMQGRRKKGCRNAFAHDISDDQERLLVRKRQDVIEIATHLASAQAKTGQTKSR